jgi:hypothetical protein
LQHHHPFDGGAFQALTRICLRPPRSTARPLAGVPAGHAAAAVPILVYTVITAMIGGLQMFDVPQVLTNGKGTPNRAT